MWMWSEISSDGCQYIGGGLSPAMQSRLRTTFFRGLLVLAFFFGCGTSIKAQPSHYSLVASGGSVIPTSGSPFTGDGLCLGFDVSTYWLQNDSSCFWHNFWHYPLIGCHFNYAQLRNTLVGNRMGISLLFQAPIYRRLDWTYSVGLSFYTNPYRFTHNPDNSFIGSVINCYIDLGFVYDIPVNRMHTLFLEAKLIHTSDGYLYKPNHGLNYLQGGLGVRWGACRPTNVLSVADTAFNAHGRAFLMVAPGMVTSRFTPDESISYYFTYTAQLGYIRHFHPCFAWGVAFDASYNFSHSRQTSAPKVPVYPALSAFADAGFGPWTLRLGLAHYIGQYSLNWTQYYERVGLYYRFGPQGRHYAGVGMKVHYDHIDFIEWTYAYEL